jgi:carbamoyl-phosphate synthase large subunit
VFSWSKLAGVDTALGPEMKSTGEVMGIGPTYAAALVKGFTACGIELPQEATALCMIADRDKPEALPILERLHRLGVRLLATRGTHAFLARHGIPSEPVRKLHEGTPNCLDALRAGRVDVVLNTLTRGRRAERDGFRVRRTAVELGIPCFTSLDTARAWVVALEEAAARRGVPPEAWALQEYAVRGGWAPEPTDVPAGR